MSRSDDGLVATFRDGLGIRSTEDVDDLIARSVAVRETWGRSSARQRSWMPRYALGAAGGMPGDGGALGAGALGGAVAALAVVITTALEAAAPRGFVSAGLVNIDGSY